MADPSNYRYLAQLGEMIEYMEGLEEFGNLTTDELYEAFKAKSYLQGLLWMMSKRLDKV